MNTLFDVFVIPILVHTAIAVAPAAMCDAPDTKPEWIEAERGVLENHVQLTFSDRFLRAGEAYFSHDDKKIIFQAIEVPTEGETVPEEFYAMFVADVVRNDDGRFTGIDNIMPISPPGSANTCGWFHPADSNVVIFASTVVPPTETRPPGFQRAEGRYRWMFPPEMDIFILRLDEADGTAGPMQRIIGHEEAYMAECALSPTGRHMVYCSLERGRGDLFIKNFDDGSVVKIAAGDGYDGGPFFSPDGMRICYRSDRVGNNLLQLYVAELKFDDKGRVTGLKREFQLTDNEHVNWAPFWHPAGRHLVYATSEISHRQYEVFIIDADAGTTGESYRPTRYGTNKRRVTHSAGFDGLPVFNSDGSLMMWTSQRSECRTSQVWVADFVMPLDVVRLPGGAERR